jgi:glycosyltransferase involved in cell wall biosynthesis
MEVWIFQTGEPLQSDSIKLRSMRAMLLSESLIKKNHKVIIWSASFFHQLRQHRNPFYSSIVINPHLEIRLITSSGYAKNIGFKRLFDHLILAYNLGTALKKETRPPNVAFIGYPAIEFAFVASSWLKKNNVPFIVDVKDQWPEIFFRTLPLSVIPFVKLFLDPYFNLGRKVIFNATLVSSISSSFLKWSCAFARRKINKVDFIFPLTSVPLETHSWNRKKDLQFWKKKGVYKDERTRFFFTGTFSAVFDFTTVKNAAVIAKKNEFNFQFVFCGDGGNIENIKREFAGLDNVIFSGWVSFSEIRTLASISDAALAPYLNYTDFLLSIPNKILDYLSFGCPIITPLKGEVGRLVKKYELGLIYKEGDYASLYNSLIQISSNKKNRARYSSNANKIYKNNFDGNKNYDNAVKHLERISKL